MKDKDVKVMSLKEGHEAGAIPTEFVAALKWTTCVKDAHSFPGTAKPGDPCRCGKEGLLTGPIRKDPA